MQKELYTATVPCGSFVSRLWAAPPRGILLPMDLMAGREDQWDRSLSLHPGFSAFWTGEKGLAICTLTHAKLPRETMQVLAPPPGNC